MDGKWAARALTCGLVITAFVSMAGAQQTTQAGITETDIQSPNPVHIAAPDRPADAAPKPPSVSCAAGRMTITADNSTIASILTAVESCIGVKFDMPAGSREERTFVHLGPGTTRTVLLALLESTDYDYVLEPSASDPATIQSVLLMARTKPTDKEEPTAAELALTPARRAWLMARRNGRPPSAEDADSQQAAADTDTATELAEPPPADPAPAGSAPAPVATADNSQLATSPAAAPDVAAMPPPASADAPGASGTNNSDTTNALQNQITNMQQLFQQRQQMVQNVNRQNSQGAPQSTTPQ